jgi:hypothetical protein
MHRVKCPITALVMLFVVTLPAWSQTRRYTVPAASVGDDFAAYGRALDSAADSALANVTREAELSSRIVEARTNATRPPDANVLHQFAEQYWNGNDQAVRRAVARVVELKPVLAPILQDEGVPDEIAAIVLVESGGQPTALSPKGARGIWQFMPDTAVLRKKSMRPHTAISSSQYSWRRPPRTPRTLSGQSAGNSCPWILGRGRGLLPGSGTPGPKLAWGRPRL